MNGSAAILFSSQVQVDRRICLDGDDGIEWRLPLGASLKAQPIDRQCRSNERQSALVRRGHEENIRTDGISSTRCKREVDAMLNWQVGAVKITSVVEITISFPEGVAFMREALQASPWLF